MLVYDATQVIQATKQPPKDWEMNGRKGTIHSAKLALLSASGDVETVVLKAKTEEELVKKLAVYTPGKPAKVPVRELIPVYKAGDRKPSGYEMVG